MAAPFEIRTAPEAVGISSAAIEKMLDSMEKFNMHGILVVRRGMVAAEGYWPPFDAKRRHRLYSVSKSITSAAIGIMIGEGLLKLEDRVAQYFTDVLPDNLHPYLAETTLRDLLIMATPNPRCSYLGPEPDWLHTFWHMPPDHAPGTLFEYDTAASLLMCHLIKRLTGQQLIEYLRPRLLAPIGADPEITCVESPEGIQWGGSGVIASLRDMAKIGYVFMNGGRWQDRQLIPEWYCRQATAKQIDDSLTSRGPGYGYQIWRQEPGNGFAFRGMGGQLMFAYPQKDLIIACHSDNQFDPTGMAIKKICQAMSDLEESVQADALPPDDAAADRLQERLASLTAPVLEGDMDSPLSSVVSGVVYDMDPGNRLGWKNMRVELKAGEGSLFYTTPRGDHRIDFGFGFRKQGFFPETHYWGERINTPKNAPYMCEACAAWVQENKLEILIYVTDDYLAGMQLELAFKGDQIAVRGMKVAEWFLDEYVGMAGGHRQEAKV